MQHRHLSRRTFLRDLGRSTLGVVVLGAVAGCGSDGPAAGGASSTDPSTSTGSTAGAGGSEAGGAGEGGELDGLAWQRASFGFVSAYVLVRDGEALVFDTGTSDGGVAPVEQALQAAGVGWDDVSTVLLSHDHGDHIGGVDQVMAAATNATARAAEPDLATLRSRVERAEPVRDGDMLVGARVVATPGHTLGHVSLYDDAAGLLLAGDALVRDSRIGGTTGEGVEASPPDFTADPAAARDAVQVLADLAPAAVLFGHGDPLLEDAAQTLATYAATL